jgi:hypothetical protein
MKHTKGPWKIGWWKHDFANHHGASIRLGNGFIIAGVFSGKDDWLQRDKKTEANARLIAAAPDLLKACKAVDEWLQANIQASNRPAKLDKLLIDAIKKAGGN